MDFPDIIDIALSQMLSLVVDPASDAELDVIFVMSIPFIITILLL